MNTIDEKVLNGLQEEWKGIKIWHYDSTGKKPLDIGSVAIICHQANKELCGVLGDDSQLDWSDSPDWQKDSAIKGVIFNLDNPNAPPSASHDSWLKEKEATGWKYGSVKDPQKKEHPCFLPFEDLPENQKAKDHLFKAIVSSLSSFVDR